MPKKDEKKTKVDYKKVSEELAQENAELNEALLRERADAMNVRKRAEDDKARMGSFYKAIVVQELLPSIDNLERAIAAAQQNTETGKENSDELVKGVQAVHRQMLQALEKLGVERIKTTGEPFNPELHEAVVMEEGGDGAEIVSEELQSGYTLGDQVVRHAMVKVKS